MLGAQSQRDQGTGIGYHFGLPSMIGLEADHGVFGVLVPFSCGFAVQVFLLDQCALDLPGSLLVNGLLPVAFPCPVTL